MPSKGGLQRSPPQREHAQKPPTSAPLPTSFADDLLTPVSGDAIVSSDQIVKPKSPFILRRNLSKRPKYDFEDESCESVIGKLTSAVSELKSFVEVNMKKILCENVSLKNELTEIKRLLSKELGQVYPASASSYSSVLKSNSVVVINPKNTQKASETRDSLNQKINPADYKMRDVRSTKKGGILIECESSEECSKLKNNAASMLGDAYDVTVPQKKCPRVRVYGFTERLDEESLRKKLYSQNPDIFTPNSVVKVAHIYEVKSKNRFGVKLEVDAKTFSTMINIGKIFVGWDSCYINEDFNIRRCFKCWGFNHVVANCSSESFRCPICSGEHQKNECNSTQPNCVACINSANYTHQKINSNHHATSDECPTLKHKIDLEKRSINYLY